MGKTTIAAALVNDEAIRGSYEKLAWVSVGQDPDIRELQDSLHHQLTGKHFDDEIKSDADAVTELRSAAKGLHILTVLDDVWDPKHEKPLNCIDPDNSSRILVTTRIRGLLKNATEIDVGVLSQPEALKLLLSSADVDDELEEGSSEYLAAIEMVELCGGLPLTLAIAGGMVANTGQGFTEDILEAMKEKQEFEDEEGMTVETRVISSSTRQMVKVAGKHKDLVAKVFRFFACFPEDVPVPASFFNKIAPLLSDDENEKKARLAVGTCLSTLLKYSLVKGSLSVGNGVFMHDIVRDYVIHQHSEEELHALQKSVVDAVLAARPEPGGFPTSQYTTLGTFEGYVARQLWTHFRGAIDEGSDPPDSWLGHSDNIVRINVAMAVGPEKLNTMLEAREATGELVRAAHLAWTASMTKGIAISRQQDLQYRTGNLLERAKDEESLQFYAKVLTFLVAVDLGSERHAVANKRLMEVSGNAATFEAKLGMAWGLIGKMVDTMGVFDVATDDGDIEASMALCLEAIKTHVEAGELSSHPSVRNYYAKLGGPGMLGIMITASPLSRWDPDGLGVSEAAMVEAIDFYQFHTCSKALSDVMKGDTFMYGYYLPVLSLWYGNLDALNTWHKKVVTGLDTWGIRESPNYTRDWNNVAGIHASGIPLLLMLGLFEKAGSLWNACGFSWDDDGFERINGYNATIAKEVKGTEFDGYVISFRIFLFLTLPKDSFDEAEVNAWMPSPQELANRERTIGYFRNAFLFDLTSFGAMAFLKLGRDEDADELCRIAVSPEQGTKKNTTTVPCHSILGKIAAKRGDLNESEGHFANALKEAKRSRLPMLEVLAARDWKMHLLEPKGRDCSAAEAVINGACVKMKKPREQLGAVLNPDHGAFFSREEI